MPVDTRIATKNDPPIASALNSDTYSALHINKIDCLRFVAAFWVAMSHGAFPLREAFPDPSLHRALGAFVSSFDGVAAVIVFFIVSGFCIHLPYVNVRKIPLLKFFLRRYIRIGIPLIMILLIMKILGGSASEGGHDVLWSIYVELVYYTIYPLLFSLSRRFGWSALVAVSGLISSAMIVIHLDYLYVWQFASLTWLWGLPVWLSGCALAALFRSCSLVNAYGNIWLWRIGAWALGAAAVVGVFHSPIKIGYPISMLGFAIFAFFWLSLELKIRVSTWGPLESFGGASYSLYLVHNVVLGGINQYLEFLPAAGKLVFPWMAIAAGTYIFYKAVEVPSHLLARWAASMVSDRSAKRNKIQQTL